MTMANNITGYQEPREKKGEKNSLGKGIMYGLRIFSMGVDMHHYAIFRNQMW